LTRNKSASAEFLEANYDKFFSHYQNLLSSDNYVTRRQALKVNGNCFLTHTVSYLQLLQTQITCSAYCAVDASYSEFKTNEVTNRR